jgi:sigma-B regulation protein RsbU (phosphoserine phosphatase)
LRLLAGVAGQAGLALENSRLASSIAQETAARERLNRELEIARDVQRRFFPQRRPAVAGLEYDGMCRPAQSVGGDFYDFRALEAGGLAIAIGDVAGKGAPAALVMASVQASLRAQTMGGAGLSLAGRITNLNALICEITPASRFATLFYAHYRPESRLLRYVNAGHNPPLLVRGAHADAIPGACGPAIGLSRSARYQERSLTLEPGDVLALFTDGVTEAMNESREDFGEERLAAVLTGARADASSAELVKAVLRAVDDHAAGAAQHDDITLVIARAV